MRQHAQPSSAKRWDMAARKVRARQELPGVMKFSHAKYPPVLIADIIIGLDTASPPRTPAF